MIEILKIFTRFLEKKNTVVLKVLKCFENFEPDTKNFENFQKSPIFQSFNSIKT